MDGIIKVLGIIALVIIAIALFPLFVAAIIWLVKIIAGFTVGGFLVILLIVIICYLIWG